MNAQNHTHAEFDVIYFLTNKLIIVSIIKRNNAQIEYFTYYNKLSYVYIRFFSTLDFIIRLSN